MADTPDIVDTSNLIELYVVGRPRSGTVWLNRLVADALDSPLEVAGPHADAPIYCGPGRDGGYVIRKTHGGEKRGPTVFIQRDPRDVAVSTMHYRSQTDLFPVVQGMCEPYGASYEYHARMWLGVSRAEVCTRYEKLHSHPLTELRHIVKSLTGTPVADKYLRAVIERQSFAVVKENDADGRLAHSMRKGVVGEWKDHFTQEIGQYIQRHLGSFMIEEGYVQDKLWWKEL